jgi:hypothetical protein
MKAKTLIAGLVGLGAGYLLALAMAPQLEGQCCQIVQDNLKEKLGSLFKGSESEPA